MANIRRMTGLVPVRHLSGSPWNGAVEIYYHSTANATAVYRGALVESAAGLAGAGSDPLGIYPTLIACAEDSITGIVGVAWTFGETPGLATRVSNLSAANYCPASTGMYIGVITDPTVVFEISDHGGTAITAAQIGSYIGCTQNLAGNTTSGQSCMAIDQAKLTATGAAYPLRLIRLAAKPNNELGTYARWEVMIQQHIYKNLGSTVALRAT